MIFIHLKNRQRIIFILCLFTLYGCKPSCRVWELDTIVTRNPEYNAGRLLLAPHATTSHLELELTRSQEGIRLYLNLLYLAAPPCEENSAYTKVSILFEGEEELWEDYLSILAGNQRLLFSEKTTQHLIAYLIDNRSFTIQIGRSTLQVIPDKFNEKYTELLLIPIEDCSCESTKV